MMQAQPAHPIGVEIVSTSSVAYPPASEVRYDVFNTMGPRVWVVRDGWLSFRLHDRTIELSYTRGRMRAGSHVFGYFPPAVEELHAGDRLSTVVLLDWPLQLDLLWNTERSAAPPPGQYDVFVRIGYGLTPRPELPREGEGVEEPALRWQHEVISPAVRMTVPDYVSDAAD